MAARLAHPAASVACDGVGAAVTSRPMQARARLMVGLCVAILACSRGGSAPASGGAATGPRPAEAAPPEPLRDAKPAPPPRPQRFDVAEIDAYVAGQVAARGIIGLALAIVREGELVLERGYGERALGAGPVRADTAFAIGSVTKQFTCASVLLLAEEGRLSLEDRVARHYPELTRAGDVALFDLLSNVSGYHDYYPLDFVDARMTRPTTVDAVIQTYAGAPLDFEPATRWSYSNTGFLVAGRVVEKVSGEELGAFMQRRIFAPLGMTRTGFTPPAEAATGHSSFALGAPEPAVPEASGWLHAAGGLHASAGDLARWSLGLIDGKLLQPASWRRMTTPRALVTGEMTDYGCGVGVVRRQGETVIQHGGAVSGFLAQSAMIPRTRSALVMLANTEGVDLGGLHGEVLSLLIEAGRPRPTVQGSPPGEVARALLRQLQAGAIDRAALGAEFSEYLTEARVAEAAPRLKALGEPSAVVLERLSERGGMEVASLRLTFADAAARALLYRTPDGKVQEFLLLRP